MEVQNLMQEQEKRDVPDADPERPERALPSFVPSHSRSITVLPPSIPGLSHTESDSIPFGEIAPAARRRV